MKFEYKMLERVYPVSESELDALGSLGWELVGMVSLLRFQDLYTHLNVN